MQTALLMVTLLTCGGVTALAQEAQHERIALYLDGQRIEFSSSVTDGPASVMPALLVDGHPMLPVRFLNEKLGQGLNMCLFSRWGLLQIGPLWFKEGHNEAIRAVKGGDAAEAHALPVRAGTIDGRFYVPALPTLDVLGFGVEWSPDERALRITRPTPPGQGRPVPSG